MTHVAVVLSGCGHLDGSEVHESVLCLLALAQAGCTYHCFAPDQEQADVINHLTREPMAEKRNALVEAARIARGDISPLSELDPDKFDAILLPGGFGAAKNLSDFATAGTDCSVNQDLKRALLSFRSTSKPIGACCIAPAVVAKSFQGSGKVQMTLGTNPSNAQQLEAMGMDSELTPSDQMTADRENKVFTTPCYMEPPNLAGMYEGVKKVVAEIKALS